MPKTILVVDDRASLRNMVKAYLTEQGFRVVTAADGQQALFLAREEKPDLILLDIMMPKIDGYEFIRIFRRERDTPIILLTAKLEETDKVLGLEMGADDYITKPFGMREMLARIRAVLRRTEKDAVEPNVLRAADIVLDREQRSVTVSGRAVNLTPTEFDLLAELMSAPGRVFSRAALLEAIQGIALESLERSINVHVRNLRLKIEADPSNPRYIETVFGVGYRFSEE
jgi:DNA-binding response OmpR family regulator